MTYSILARDPATGWCGLAIASRAFAVGSVCPWTRGFVGLVASQATTNPANGRRALATLAEGLDPAAVVERIHRADPGAPRRQLHVLAWDGRTAAHTGRDCVDWCGHRTAADLSVAGNMLKGPEVVDATFERFAETSGPDLVRRLLDAMWAGEAAGGDKRGKQAAALVIQGPEAFQRLNLRVDDHANPLAELERLYAVAREVYLPFSEGWPSPTRPDGIVDRAALDERMAAQRGAPFDPGRF